MFLIVVYFIIGISIAFYCILYGLVKVQIGKPPINLCVIGYKYTYAPNKSAYSGFSFLKNSIFSLKTHKLLKLCYFSFKDKHKIECAQGVVLHENGILNNDGSQMSFSSSYSGAEKLGLQFFTTPPITHAVYVEFPVLLSFTLSKLLAILISYPKIHHILELKNLCAYPVIEVYSKKSITIAVPLIKQDCYIVPEAEKLVFGKYYTGYFQVINTLHQRGKNYLSSLMNGHLESSKIKSPKAMKRITKG